MFISRAAACSRHSLKNYRIIFQLLLITTAFALCGALSNARAATINVPAGGSLQAAINSAQPGDEIVLEAGATYMGPITLPVKAGASYITVRSSAIANLPPEGTRVTPDYASAMPKIVSSGTGNPALQTQPGAHHFRFIGIEFKPANSAAVVYDLIKLGSTGTQQNTLAQVPHHLTFDRCFIHGDPATGIKRGIALNSAYTEVLNCYISDAKGKGQDTQALGGWNGPGPFTIINNYLEAAGENVMFGGADPSIPGLVPSDIEFRRNYLYKPPSWRGVWTVKNIFELKNAQRVIVDGNILENCWADGQEGTSILFTPRNQEGTAPWSLVQDVQFTNNIVRHVASAMSIYGHDDGNHTDTRTNNITIRNNVFDDVNGQAYGGRGMLLLIMDSLNVTFEHNTIFQTGNIIMAFGAPSNNFVFRNNISPVGSYGIFGDAVGQGTSGIAKYFPDGTFVKNVIAGAPGYMYPANNFFPSTIDAALFVNRAAGDYRLSASSPYKNAGTDGKDLGCDIEALNAAQSSSQPSPNPTPTPTPAATPNPTPVPTPLPTPVPTPVATPQPTPVPVIQPAPSGALISDDFNDNVRDATKWNVTTLNDEATTWSTQVGVNEQNQRLEIAPSAGVAGKSYNGYVSAANYNLTNATATVEVIQTTTSGADTIFAIGIDTNNWYRFVVEDGQLYFQDKVSGVKSSANLTYNSAQHRFWRFRHNPTGDQVVFETSADGTNWTVQRTVQRQINTSSLRFELDAGTFSPVGAPGKAIFDNFKMVSNDAPTSPASGTPAILLSNGAGVVFNEATMKTGPFDVQTEMNLGDDKRTRLMIFASGVTSSTNTSHASNYVTTGAVTFANLAEAVKAEARTSDGRVFQLPVEYAGAQGTITGLDQVNVVLVPELKGAGNVQLTISVGSYRTNSVTVTVR